VKTSSLPVVPLVLTVPQTTLDPATNNSKRISESASTTESTDRLLVISQEKPEPAKASKVGIWGIFCSTFFTIFLAEMGDKTQLATLLMSAQSDSPWVVFAGAALALIATSLLGVVIGCWIAKRFSPKTIETSAGALLLFISVMLLWDVVKF
jgi:putative Ca2+/H+ antiporter (TMEM165/GDT1 family)